MMVHTGLRGGGAGFLRVEVVDTVVALVCSGRGRGWGVGRSSLVRSGTD